jgi:RNA polymerase subunit RPABC4/transcription elongation factor Spt4
MLLPCPGCHALVPGSPSDCPRCEAERAGAEPLGPVMVQEPQEEPLLSTLCLPILLAVALLVVLWFR